MRAVPDPSRRLTDGILIEASVMARVLGVRLLTLDTTVVLVPADVQVPSSRARAAPPRMYAIPARVARTRSGAPGRALADAVKSINEGANLLATTRTE